MTNHAAGPDWRTLYPFASHELLIDGHRYHFVDEGQGEPLLFVHGNPTWSFYWRRLIERLRGGFRTVAVDHMGCGLSDKPQQYEYRLARHIENLKRLIEHLDLKQITLVGHDWGGAIGLGAATQMPERFSRLVLMNTGGFRAPTIPLRIRVCRVPGFGRVAVQGLNGFVLAALKMATTKPGNWSPEQRAGYLAPYDNWSNRQAVYRFVEDIPLVPAHPSYATLLGIEQGLARLRDLPTCLIWGMQDWCFTPWFLNRFVEFFPAAEVHRLADAGHFVVEDAPEEVFQAINQFLSRNPVTDTTTAIATQ